MVSVPEVTTWFTRRTESNKSQTLKTGCGRSGPFEAMRRLRACLRGDTVKRHDFMSIVQGRDDVEIGVGALWDPPGEVVL